MNAKRGLHNCQIHCVPRVAQSIGFVGELQYLYSRAKRFLKRRLNYVWNRLATLKYQGRASNGVLVRQNDVVLHFRAGDLVRIKSAHEIHATLNVWNSLRGCTFAEEMWPYCGTTQRVMKRMERFLDERDYHIKKSNGIVILEGLICAGSIDFGRCDRSCFFFWREEWLERVDE